MFGRLFFNVTKRSGFMDLDSLKEGFGLVGKVLSLLKEGKDLIPQSDKKEELEKTIKEAEEKFNVAKERIVAALRAVTMWPVN